MINSISKNEYQFLKRCKKHFSYEPPVEIILDQPNEHAYYIPLKKSLSYTLQDGQLLHAIIDNINSLSNRAAQDKDLVLSNRQGHFVKTNLYRQTNSNVLLLKLYTDDDLPEVIRSQVNSIGLHCICYTKHLNNDNSRTILTNVLVEDINKLQTDGITIPCLSSRIYFVFSSVCGDNLASNEVGGFQNSFSSGSFCRHCSITYQQKHISLTDISFLPRTRLKHDIILNQIILNNGREIIQGVKGPSWFKDLIGFHPTESLPPDVMHDFSEEEDIDGATLALLQHNDLIQIFPRVKDRVKFVDQRAKLILYYNDQQASKDAATLGVSDSTLSGVQLYDELENNDMLNSVDANENIVTNNRASTTDSGSSSNLPANDDDGDIYNKPMLPDDYEGPNLTSRMEEYIEQENITKFNPHTRLRSELLSLIYDNVTKSYDLLYPSHDDYLRMAKLIVNKLRIPPTLAKNSIKDWHESLKQKFKRERKPLQMNNDLVKSKQDKYGNGKTNGRPKKKSLILQAERRTFDLPLINLADRQNEHLLAIVNQMNTELLKDDPNNDLLRDLWIQSFNIRRLCIRELDIVEILERFPGYRRSEMILAEVKESTDIDIEENVNVLLPKFFDHIPDNNCFLADVLPVRVVRILCKLFGDTVKNIFTYEEVLTPGPCMKILDDKFELYLHFHLITHTSFCSQALALLISLYYVFEIKFGHHSRSSRLLYGVPFEDTHYLNKALKNLLNSWKYKIVNRSFVRRQVVVTNLVESLTQPSTTNEHVSSPSDISDESAHVPTEQSHSDRYTSSQLNVTISRNIDEENINEVGEDDFTQPSATVEDHIYQSSTTTRQALAPLTNSSIIIQNKSAPVSHAEDSFLNLNSKELHQIHTSQTFSSTQELENEIDPAANPDKSSSAVSRKRKAKTPRSSSSISTPKTSARLEAKRARLH
ncbi:unnamed protein product [Adineta steineri]|uniref:Uncharacterized protein n=1 Tax=Adineta steineri TaxID=433720 RepID=A0A815DSN5_9BILA|nr:unnamed protein product [Adineta steineri]